MVNYNNGKIYKIVDNTNNNIYVGSTTKKYLSDRLSEHRCDYRRYLKGTNGYLTSCEIIKNNNYDIILLELVNCDSKDELKAKERFYIDTLDCVNKVIPGRTNKEYREVNKDRLNKIKRDNYDKELNQKNCKKGYEKHKDKRIIYQKELRIYQSSWGGDIRADNNNLLKIDINLFA